MPVLPLNQYDVESRMREGWELMHDEKLARAAFKLWPPRERRADSPIYYHVHGKSAEALIAAGKLVQSRPKSYGITWYKWKRGE